MPVSQIGRYRVLRELGRGSGAIVYQGRDPDSGKQVAIKVFYARLTGGEDFAERFEATLRTLRTLEHPYLVPVLNYGIEKDEEDSAQVAYYVVTQYMPGGTLAERIDGRPLLLSEAVPILQRLAEALDAAHAAGLLHGGLNPEQVLFDIRNRAYLTDVGLRELLRPAVQGRVPLPGMSALAPVGTPAYLSPEQIQGDPPDGRVDVYALGVMLFEMLTGRQPFQADTTEALLQKHLDAPVPVLSETVLSRLVLPPAFNHVMERALAKSRDDRYPTAGVLTEAVRTTFLMAPAEPVEPAPPPPPPPVVGPGPVGEAAETAPSAPPPPPEESLTEAAPAEPEAVAPEMTGPPEADAPDTAAAPTPEAMVETAPEETQPSEIAAGVAAAAGVEGDPPPPPEPPAAPPAATIEPPPPPRPLPVLPDPDSLAEMVREPETPARAPFPWREWAGAGMVLILVVLALWRWSDIRAIFIQPTATPTLTATATLPPTATVPAVVVSPTQRATASATASATPSPSVTPTSTRTRTPTRAASATTTGTTTRTPAPTLPLFTATPTSTATVLTPTGTATETQPPPPPAPSDTPVPPSATPTPTVTPTPTAT